MSDLIAKWYHWMMNIYKKRPNKLPLILEKRLAILFAIFLYQQFKWNWKLHLEIKDQMNLLVLLKHLNHSKLYGSLSSLHQWRKWTPSRSSLECFNHVLKSLRKLETRKRNIFKNTRKNLRNKKSKENMRSRIWKRPLQMKMHIKNKDLRRLMISASLDMIDLRKIMMIRLISLRKT